MTGQAVIKKATSPTAYKVTGSGTVDCSTNDRIPVGLAGSQTGVIYQLKLGIVNIGDPVAGTGAAINFGNQGKGTYTVIATSTSTGCTSNMSGSAIITQTGTKPGKPGPISLVPVNNVRNKCGGGNFTYSIAAVPRALSYVWTPVTGGSVVSNNGTTAVLSFPANFTTGTIKVQAVNNCGISLASSVASAAVNTPVGINGPTSVTSKQKNVVYNIVNPDPTVIYQWVVPSGVTIVSGQNTPTLTVNWGATSGAIKARTNASCGSSAYIPWQVNVVSGLTDNSNFAAVKAAADEFSVSPNPTSGKALAFFTTHAKDKYVVEVTDVYGKALLRKELISVIGKNQVELDVSRLPNAMYFVTLVNSKSERKTLKLVKAR